MKNKSIALSIILLLSASTLFAQKLKYKDIFALLEKKQYEAAEPLLKQYLEKDIGNANALLYMGIINMEKYYKILPQDKQAAKKSKDDAIHYLQLAKLNMDKKEVSKNERYYQAYKRRDLRSGTFQVSQNDIVTDIDKRIAKLNEEN